MAAKTPDAVYSDSLGSVRLIRAEFSTTNVDDTDTYASGITGIVDTWFSTDITTGAVGTTHSGSTITFACSAANQTGTLFILVRS